jgi:hypothetical protein
MQSHSNPHLHHLLTSRIKAVLGGYPVWQIRNPSFQLVKTKLELGMISSNWFWNWNLNLLRTGPRTKEKKFEDREFLPHGSDN